MAKGGDLLGRLVERVVAIDLRADSHVSLLQLAAPVAGDFAHLAQVAGGKLQLHRIDEAALDIGTRLAGTLAGSVGIHQAAIAAQVRVQIPAGTRQDLAEVHRRDIDKSRRARDRIWRKFTGVTSTISAPTWSLTPKTSPRMNTSRCRPSRQSSVPIVQQIFVSSTRISTGTGTVRGSGRSRSGTFPKPRAASSNEQTAPEAFLIFSRWLTATRYSQVRNLLWPRNPGRAKAAFRSTSWVAS